MGAGGTELGAELGEPLGETPGEPCWATRNTILQKINLATILKNIVFVNTGIKNELI